MDHSDENLGVALSGGGVRASLFTLGSLLYLVDSGLNRRVTEISSVSGGSITNGFVAQRCDFRSATSEEFDEYAGTLVGAITRGLLPEAFLIGVYAIAGLLLVTVIFLSWPVGLPFYADILLVLAFGWGLLVRGTLLERALQHRLFSSEGHPTILGEIESSVAHVFCATDLNSSLPVYFTNRAPHVRSSAWGGAGSADAGNIRLAIAVRASAAFPGGIPPKRLELDDLGVELTPFQSVERVRRLAFRDVEQPRALYLSDGGVWNNLGTDWFEQETRWVLQTYMELQPRSKRLLVVDASSPTAAKTGLPSLRCPWLAELFVLGRAFLVSYTSTVAARIAALEESRRLPVSLARMTEPMGSGTRTDRIAWLGHPELWSGQLTLASAIARILRPWTLRRRWIVRRLALFHLWSSRVPTKLSRIPKEVAVQLMIHGYVATERALSADAHDSELPPVERFAKLAGIEAVEDKLRRVWVFGPRSEWEGRTNELTLACLRDTTEALEEVGRWTCPVVGAADKHVEQVTGFLEKLTEPSQAVAYVPGLAGATLAAGRKEYVEARRLFDEALASYDLTDDAVDPQYVAQYACVLARLGDPRASDVSAIGEQRASEIDERMKGSAVIWFVLAQAHALLGDGRASIRCLHRHAALVPEDTSTFLSDLEGREGDPFASLRHQAEFVQFTAGIDVQEERAPEDGMATPGRSLSDPR